MLISGETSTRKAYTALQLNSATPDVAAAVKSDGPLYSLQTALDRPLLFLPGGILIHRGDRLVGAIGVGGGTPDQDHGFAAAALAKLGE